jgi:hypothetical protein
MSRAALFIAVLSLTVAAHAAPAPTDDAAAFRAAVEKSAAEDKRWIEAWGTANLDNDPALERVALLCSTEGERKGYWVVEKDASHRFELTFDVDSRTRACQKKPTEAPPWETRKAKTVDVYQGHVEGYEQTNYALRAGRFVIVREEEWSGKKGEKPKISDWDQLTKGKKGAVYRSSDQARELPPR